MKQRRYPIQVWFLDKDPAESAKLLSNKYLVKNIHGCVQALITAYFYYIGIRSSKFYKYYFNKVNCQETMDKFFFLWPLKLKPKFLMYTTRLSRWCRKCKEHFDYIESCLKASCDEYFYRFSKEHAESKILDWLHFDAKLIKIPAANLKTLTLEWKSLDPKYRRKDIPEGYKLQYKAMLLNYPLLPNDFTNRDIPEFLTSKEEDKWLA